ncbi:MAG: Bcr/CflA family multidrug efflux MFS transporter [Gammaproteobacteria bacterium]|uniref:Bcr/CflA family efflux transporter n=1 Tax=Tolumonas osonensis TaxID=675874 RepID=A0A841GEW7_9GAMM|nr:Bcr/CflA family multidrug efflux MFS transporter [Tolumonas osonensis]MBB6056117.1 DHA1 family bicyclomycin/chloramphenicol resistance-like MFS transporter [Tolumonas osonensis]NCB60099.1 Bcr/CflA family multidrug efflux MFS transporter [Gammaproteobacteria bacterium]
MSEIQAEFTTSGVIKTEAPATQDLWVLVVLSLLMSFSSVSTDLYLPAMPVISQDLQAFSGGVELTISAFLIGFSSGQLLWGPLGDRYGRKMPIFAGLILFVLGAAGCAMSETIYQMIGWRIVQALGACAGPVLARAMIRDLYGREKSAQMLSTLVLIMGIAPLIGPLVGGQILAVSSWHAIFWTLVLVGCISIIALFTVPETLTGEKRTQEPLSAAFRDYFIQLRNPVLLGYVASGAFFYVGIYAFVAGSPFAYIDYYHLDAQAYGLLFGANIIGIMGVNLVNSRLVMKLGVDRLFYIGTWFSAVAGVALAVNAWSGWGGVAGLAVPIFVFTSMNGLIVANSVAGALDTAPHKAGTTSSLIGALHYGSGVISAAILGLLTDGTPWTMGLLVGIAGVGSLVSATLLRRFIRKTA